MILRAGLFRRLPVSIVIPTKDAGPRFRETLEAIRRQAGRYDIEIIVVDSGSSDETVALSERYGAQVLSIPAEAFNHGEARNEGIRRARGEFVALLVQDAVPADKRWLDALVRALHGDPQVAGAYSRHLGRPDCDYVGRYAAEYWHEHVGRRWVQEIADPIAFQALPFAERRDRCTFNNVSAIVRRSVWERYPFPCIAYAEDVAWAKQVLEEGYRIVYEPASRVLHSHERPPAYELRRSFVDARALAGIFALPGEPMPVVQAQALLRHFEAQLSLATAAPEAGDGAALPRIVESYCEGEDWYRSHFNAGILRRMFGPHSPWSAAEKQRLLDDLDQRELAARAGRATAASDRRGEQRLPISGRIGEVVAGGGISAEDLDAVYTWIWQGSLGRDLMRGVMLAVLREGPPDPLDAVEQEQRAFAYVVLKGAAAEGSLTYPLYWRVRALAAAWAIGRRLGLASVAAEGRDEEPFWRDLVRRWAPGI